MTNLAYDDTNEKSIVKYAKKLVGKYIYEIIDDDSYKVNIKNKGIIGNIIEEYYFGIKQNSSPEPDFEKVGIELKIIPLLQQNKKIVVKERTKVCSINYTTLVNEQWSSSHAKKKLNKILFIYYLYNKEEIEKSEIKRVALWNLSQDQSELIIQDDWQRTKQKVLDGYAHLLSERYFNVLSPARSGQGGVDKVGKQRDLVPQPNQLYEKAALKRAFTLKQSFTNQIWNELNAVKYESIIDSLKIDKIEEFEEKVLQSLNRFESKSIDEIASLFGIKILQGKNQVATVIKKALGFKSVQAHIKEFEQLGIIVKTLKISAKRDTLLEAPSFPVLKLQEFEKEEFEESSFLSYIEKILFIPVYYEEEKRFLGKSFFWSPSDAQMNQIKKEWLIYQDEVKKGFCSVVKVTNNSPRGYKEVSKLSKESQTEIIHLRPHARDSSDRDSDSHGNSIVKQSFWLNKKFLNALLKNQR